MIKHSDSHTDHGLTTEQWACVFDRFAGHNTRFIETFELSETLGTVLNGLYGPSCGDPPVSLNDVRLEARGNRTWLSRMVDWPARPTRFVRVLAGPHDGHPCVLYTAYGVASIDMPQAPKEPGGFDIQIAEITTRYAAVPSIEDHELLHKLYALRDAAQAFWDHHALARE